LQIQPPELFHLPVNTAREKKFEECLTRVPERSYELAYILIV